MTSHHDLEPAVIIGKQGITDNTITQITNYLEKHNIIKIKFLPSAIGDQDKKKLAEELAARTGAKLIHRVGFVAVLEKIKK